MNTSHSLQTTTTATSRAARRALKTVIAAILSVAALVLASPAASATSFTTPGIYCGITQVTVYHGITPTYNDSTGVVGGYKITVWQLNRYTLKAEKLVGSREGHVYKSQVGGSQARAVFNNLSPFKYYAAMVEQWDYRNSRWVYAGTKLAAERNLYGYWTGRTLCYTS